jgi:hypothetical protein
MAAPNIITTSLPSFHHLRSVTVNVGTVAQMLTATTLEHSVTVTGLAIADTLQPGDQILSVTKPTYQAGLAVTGARVTAANTVKIAYANPSAGSITPTGDEDYQMVVFRPSAPFKTTFAG